MDPNQDRQEDHAPLTIALNPKLNRAPRLTGWNGEAFVSEFQRKKELSDNESESAVMHESMVSALGHFGHAVSASARYPAILARVQSVEGRARASM